jgi:hypothetical protein
MWRLHRKATLSHRLPNEVFDPTGTKFALGGEYGPLAAWMLDNACMTWGTIAENALAERNEVKIGKKTQYTPRYTLPQLLDPRFKLPRPVPVKPASNNPWAVFLDYANQPGSKIVKMAYAPPADKVN